MAVVKHLALDERTTPRGAFWPDHEARCYECRQSIAYGMAQADGWKEIEPLDQIIGTNLARQIRRALCWRCDRERRAAETPMPRLSHRPT